MSRGSLPVPFRYGSGALNDDVQVSEASNPKRATALTDRKLGIGCDQLIIMEVLNTAAESNKIKES